VDYSRSVGGAAIGARLRRLSEAFDADTARVYAELGIAFEQRWFGVMNQLVLNGSATVGELAAALRITHASVSQTRTSLERAGLVASARDREDARRRRLILTEAGRDLAGRLAPVWAAFEDAARELDAEAGAVAQALDRLDDALVRQTLHSRIRDRLPRDH